MPSSARPAADARGWLRGIRFSWFAFVMLCVIVIGVLIIAPTARLYAQQQDQIAKLESQNSAKKAKVESLKKQVDDWDDPAYIRAQARERLLYVMPGETSYLIIDDLPATASTAKPTVTTQVQEKTGDWAGTLVRSMLTGPAEQYAKEQAAKKAAAKKAAAKKAAEQKAKAKQSATPSPATTQ
ncbi:FtsB family cell division protein [Gryllotalpicola ginsengisoli]|uniref:FtsB family cell division protein n=1 Tax=Gryllotalpicola ginsengisoli TaxID=444608 RepID=UPI0003B41D2C|nr:septum formation initiator family protein [Gryllotalpicola ginsengisoli]